MREPQARNRTWVALAAVSVLVAALAVFVLGGADAAPRHGPNQTRLILRLNDLPAGYLKLDLQEEQGERIFCSRLHHVEDTPAEIARLVDRFHPKGCVGTYYRLYAPPGQSPGPLVVGTGVLAMGSAGAADAAWDAAPELLAQLMSGRRPRPVPTSEKVGAATELLHARETPRFYPLYRKVGAKASFLLWRSGNTIATIMVIGDSFTDIDDAAVELARRQQEHIRHPTRYTLAERFDGEVPLDDPAIDVPVYWLGRNFHPGGGLPDNRLFDSYFTGKATPETFDGFAEGPVRPSTSATRPSAWTPGRWRPGVFSPAPRPARRSRAGSAPGRGRSLCPKARRRSSVATRRTSRNAPTKHRKRLPPGSTSAASKSSSTRLLPPTSSKSSIPTAPSRAWKRSSAA